MLERLSQRDKRALKIGAICAVGVVAFVFGTKLFGRWAQVRRSLAEVKAKLEAVSVDKARQTAMASIVPVFEMPQKEETQKFLFRNKLNEQLKKAGVNSKPLQVLPAGKPTQDGYRLLRLKCNAKCKFGQLLDLLAKLNENPYLVGIEEMRVRCDPKNREDVELDLTVSTFVK
jgi:hypothetical protein